MIMRWVFTMVFVFLASASYADLFSDDYDSEFEEYAEIFLTPGTDWYLLKAQCYQESRLDPFAVSPVGASGLCQFMPATWREVSQALNLTHDDVWLPEASIRAAAYYMGRLHRTWSAPRPAMDRYMLAAASYNAGAGNLIQAQRLCDGENRYRFIIPCLPDVTGEHANETIGYVDNIIRVWYPRLLFQ